MASIAPGAELGLLCLAMRAPECAIERGAALRDALGERVVEMWRRRQALPVDKRTKCGTNSEHYDDRNFDPAQLFFLLFGRCGVHGKYAISLKV